MGACGCGDFAGDFKFKGPDDIIYVLQIYPPCDNCDTPAGIIIYAFNCEDCKTWGVSEIPEVEISDVGTLFQVIHPQTIKENILEGLQYYIDQGEISNEINSAVYQAIKNNRERLIPTTQENEQ